MAKIETLRSLALASGHNDLPVLRPRASSNGYDAGATGRRAYGWNPPRLGQNTLLTINLEQMRSRSRDEIRNNPWATAAIDRFESNIIGTGIQPHWQHPDPKINLAIQSAWDVWVEEADYIGQSNFYSLQALVAREVFEAGEVFSRYRVRPTSDKLYIPLQLQLLEGEQLPVFLNSMSVTRTGNTIRAGIEYDSEMRRVQYHFYREHPGESMFYASAGMSYIIVPAAEIQHVFRPIRAGQFRGEPRMTAVLTLLYELEQYHDAALVKKKIAAMLAGFITKPVPESNLLPPSPIGAASDDPNVVTQAQNPSPDLGTDVAKLETGTLQELLPGEGITFGQAAQESDFEVFMDWSLHKFCAGVGLTFEQITGNLKGVNYSSIRAGMLEFRRGCEQFQASVMVAQFCRPVMKRWLKEAVMCGRLNLPGYFKDPRPYENVSWVGQGWEWVDPLKEAEAALLDVRAGFDSRTMIVRGKGGDPNKIDAQQVEERKRNQDLGLVYTSDPNQILEARETQPTIEVDASPEADDQGEGEVESGTGPSKLKKRAVPIPAKPIPGQPNPNKNGKVSGPIQ